MIIGVDARFVTRFPRRGIGNYSLNLISQLVELNPEIFFILFISEKDVKGELPVGENVRIVRIICPLYIFWEQIALPFCVLFYKIDILHCLGNTGPIFLPRSCSLILSLMDVMFLQSGDLIPEPKTWYQILGKIYRKFVVPIVARKSAQIITISNFSKDDICSSILGISADKITVGYLACSPEFSSAIHRAEGDETVPRLARSKPYIFALGASDPRKNTVRLVEAYLSLLHKGQIEYDLVICGYQGWRGSDAYNLVLGCNANDRVKFHSYVATDELVNLYRGATIFVYPSLYEGFGIPVLESLAVGCPVVASSVTSIPEVAGDAAIFFDPNDVCALANAMDMLLSNSVGRQKLRANGLRQAAKFSWESAARITSSVYENSTYWDKERK